MGKGRTLVQRFRLHGSDTGHVSVGGVHRLLELLLLRRALIVLKDITHRGVWLDARRRHCSEVVSPEESDDNVSFLGVFWRLIVGHHLYSATEWGVGGALETRLPSKVMASAVASRVKAACDLYQRGPRRKSGEFRPDYDVSAAGRHWRVSLLKKGHTVSTLESFSEAFMRYSQNSGPGRRR